MVLFNRYIRASGEVALQKNLSRERPAYRALHVDTVTEMLQVVCRNSVVWGLTSDRNLVVQFSVTGTPEEGLGWSFLQGSVDILYAHDLLEVSDTDLVCSILCRQFQMCTYVTLLVVIMFSF